MGVYSFSYKAEQDISHIFEYSIETFGLVQAQQYNSELQVCLERLSANPNLGRNSFEIRANLKYFYFQSHTIYYVSNADGVLVVRILGNQMDAKRHM
jgi:toxin ParE1/3/4